ncbi:hypothetical protein VTN77DRAFT_5624 [Rasamsonia byssochlamydoides]|uniref:uncharacterized protein n=1 Tax=Rasamsonia byssochlamydoides TaxID=89139 RepID=UPI003742A1AB
MQPLTDKARSLVDHLTASLDTPYGISSMTPAVYDTAWLAMVCKDSHWLFPECFQFLLVNQSSEGGFGAQSSEVDGILHTMAALLALLKHEKSPSIGGCPAVSDTQERIERGRDFLQRKLQRWDVQSTLHVGFEILVPALLECLRREGLEFQFPGSKALVAINQQKLAGFSPSILYSSQETTLLHSLEAFIGKVDFDKISHHLRNGAMMGSPSSTAAYLMNCSTWDHQAEAYLRAVASAGHGAVPSAFPTPVFEITWAISTLVESGFTTNILGRGNLGKIADFLEEQLRAYDGVIGFAPGMLPDADDTAKTILSLSLLGRPTSCERMIAVFETPTHFMTYRDERNESFSANCNVLKALLRSESPSRHLLQIIKAAGFLCHNWYVGKVNDKWNLEDQHSMMLLADVLTLLLKLWENDALLDLPVDLVNRIPIVTFQVLVRTLSAQSEQGAWKQNKHSIEITAYAVLTLKLLSSLPWARALETIVQDAINRGCSFLETRHARWTEPEYVWIEKVSYGSRILSEVYCLAALRLSGEYAWGEKVTSLRIIETGAVDKFAQFFSKLPIFSAESGWRLRASIIEGYLFAPALRQMRLDIFPRKDMSEDKYLEYIPFTWTLCNNNNAGFGLSTDVIWEMMIISMLNFQVDEYVETVVGEKLKGRFGPVRGVIRQLFSEEAENGSLPHSQNGMSTNGSSQDELLLDVKTTLSRFINRVLSHPKVSSSSPVTRRRIKQELCANLLAHVKQAEDNARLFAQSNSSAHQDGTVTKIFSNLAVTDTYFNWVRTTSADQTSCPYSFELFSCLIAPSGKDCFHGAVQKYLAQDLCRHLASMCRQYNDYGSIARDRAEENLNSVNFPEFHEDGNQDGNQDDSLSEDRIRGQLVRIANYERECLELAAQKLVQEVAPSTWKALQVFIDVTDLYGQIYVVRDIASRMK